MSYVIWVICQYMTYVIPSTPFWFDGLRFFPFGFVVAKSLGPRTSSITPSNSSLEFTSPDRSLLWVNHCRTAGFVAENQAATSLSCAVTIWEGFSCTRWALECVHATCYICYIMYNYSLTFRVDPNCSTAVYSNSPTWHAMGMTWFHCSTSPSVMFVNQGFALDFRYWRSTPSFLSSRNYGTESESLNGSIEILGYLKLSMSFYIQ